MKNISSKIIITGLALLSLGACKTYSHSSRIVDVSSQDVEAEKFVVDVEPNFNNRIKGSSTKKHKVEKLAKEEAYFNAIIDNNIDVLIDPIYSVTTTKKILLFFGGKSEALVYGYAGYYKNVRSLSQDKQEEFDAKVANLAKVAKIGGVQREAEEKTYTVNSTCGDCKGSDPLTLIAITKNKQSLLEVYEDLAGSSTGTKSGSRNVSSSNSSSSSDSSILSKIKNKIKSKLKKK